jgi:hypothetical protein
MTASIYHPTELVLNPRTLGVLVLLASAIVVARDNERLDAPPEVNTMMSDEIYEQAEGWRGSGATGGDWRAPEPQPSSRIHFGFDSAFEEKQIRNIGYRETQRSNLRETRPNTQFRIDFFPQIAP